ncbi:glycoside hydrolase family 88 protein [Flagellimonas sp.]|uniref:glycoside hydrolase family 88 protein n=1 Tax=Flagellimonas sp. TaxID=2058762 RepID=UPI003AB7515A
MIVVAVGFALGCRPNGKSKDTSPADIQKLLGQRYRKLLNFPVAGNAIPRSKRMNSDELWSVSPGDWTSGFFSGNLWSLFQLTGDSAYFHRAKEWTALMESEKNDRSTHDVGFKMMSSFGRGYALNQDSTYREILIQSARTLSLRFNTKVQSLRSWDFNRDLWEFPVIIDNMMNLELLFEATRMTGDSIYYDIAVAHANTTLNNHFRPDNSTYHVVVYDTLTGGVKERITHQGYKNESTWARGQAWAIYGFTMAYRYTKDPRYVDRARAAADYFLGQPNLPKDGIPFWDFHDEAIPNAPRDASAACILASALFELAEYTKDATYVGKANNILDHLRTESYVLSADHDIPFILDHSTGNLPKDSEIDVPIVYADYYFLEAVLRQQQLERP